MKKNISGRETIKVSSTPVFLLGSFNDVEEEPSGISVAAIIFIVIGAIILFVILGFVGLYCFRRFIQKKDIPMDKNIIKSLL